MADTNTPETQEQEPDVKTVPEPDEPTEPEPEEQPTEPEWTPPSREEWEADQKAKKDLADKLKKSNADAGRHRAKVKELEKVNEDDAARAQREALEAAQARYKPVVAKSALLEANARTDRVGALIKLLNMDALEFDGNDEVNGLDLEVSRLQDEYPEFFTQPEPEKPASAPAPKPAPRAAAATKRPPKPEEKPFNEVIAERILGKQ